MTLGLTSRSDPTPIGLFKLWTIVSLWFFRRLTSSVKCRPRACWQVTSIWVAVACGVLIAGSPLLEAIGFGDGGVVAAKTLATPSRSSTIALTSDEKRIVVVNREANSVSVIRVKNANGMDVGVKLDEIPVDLE